MSIPDPTSFTPTERELAGQRHLNSRLARLPRFGVAGPVRRRLLHALLWLGDRGADRRVRRQGLTASRLEATHEGRRLKFRVLAPPTPPRAIIFDVHGGAWALGSPAMDDSPNAAIARATGGVVLACDYALAMPRPIAALQDEVAAALEWLLTRRDGPYAELPVVVVGESAGAHLALSALIRVRDAGVSLARVRATLLHCGAYDLGGSPSAQAAGPDTLVLRGPLMDQIDALLPGVDEAARRDPALSPVFADLSGLPPSLIVVGDIDPLRDDSAMLADAFAAAGVTCQLVSLPDAPHGIIHLPGHYASRVRRAAADWLARHLA